MADISIEVNEINVVSVERYKKIIIIHERMLMWLHFFESLCTIHK